MTYSRESPAVYILSPYLVAADSTISAGDFLVKIPIFAKKVTDLFTTEQFITALPNSDPQTNPSTSLTIDIGRIGWIYEIQGYIKDYGKFTAHELRALLKLITQIGGTVRFKYDLNQYDIRVPAWNAAYPTPNIQLGTMLLANMTYQGGTTVSIEDFGQPWLTGKIVKFTLSDLPLQNFNAPEAAFDIQIGIQLAPEETKAKASRLTYNTHGERPVMTNL